MKKKKIKRELERIRSRLSYLERNCEIKEKKYVTFYRWKPLPKIDVPQEEGEGTLLEKYLARRAERDVDIHSGEG